MKDGFKKVAQSGSGFIVATFFNPETGEEFSKCVRDYDYADGSRDDDELYYMPIDADARKIWGHKYGRFFVGDTVEVFKGRKVAVGTVGEVVKVYDVLDKYRRPVALYVLLSTGDRTNINNCRLVA